MVLLLPPSPSPPPEVEVCGLFGYITLCMLPFCKVFEKMVCINFYCLISLKKSFLLSFCFCNLTTLPGLAHVHTYPSWQAVTKHSSRKTNAVRRSWATFFVTRGSIKGTSFIRGHWEHPNSAISSPPIRPLVPLPDDPPMIDNEVWLEFFDDEAPKPEVEAEPLLPLAFRLSFRSPKFRDASLWVMELVLGVLFILDKKYLHYCIEELSESI